MRYNAWDSDTGYFSETSCGNAYIICIGMGWIPLWRKSKPIALSFHQPFDMINNYMITLKILLFNRNVWL